jgi:hypothetical protein
MSEIGSVFGDTARADGRAVAKASDLEVGREVAQGVGRSPLSLTVNGQIRTMVVEPPMTMLDALREELALTITRRVAIGVSAAHAQSMSKAVVFCPA